MDEVLQETGAQFKRRHPVAKRPFDALPESDAVMHELHDADSQEALDRGLAMTEVGERAEVQHDDRQRLPGS